MRFLDGTDDSALLRQMLQIANQAWARIIPCTMGRFI